MSGNMGNLVMILFVDQSYELEIQMIAMPTKSRLYRPINYSSREKRRNSAVRLSLKQISLV